MCDQVLDRQQQQVIQVCNTPLSGAEHTYQVGKTTTALHVESAEPLTLIKW